MVEGGGRGWNVGAWNKEDNIITPLAGNSRTTCQLTKFVDIFNILFIVEPLIGLLITLFICISHQAYPPSNEFPSLSLSILSSITPAVFVIFYYIFIVTAL